MAVKYASHVSTKKTPQSEPVLGKNQILNSAGGYVFEVTPWVRLDRFLVLGSEGGTYYVGERKLTQANAKCVLECAKLDHSRTVARIAEISDEGRAPKNDPAIFALALIASHGSDEAKREAFAAVNKVCRIGTHVFQFAAACNEMRGWGRGLKRAIANWYESKEAGQLSYQMLKYQQRDGWSHADLLRLSHVKSRSQRSKTGETPKGKPTYADGKAGSVKDELFRWALRGWKDVGEEPHPEEALRRIWAFERLKRNPAVWEAVKLIRDHGLTREAIPTELLTEPAVWEALLEDMPLTAMIRNLATMTRVGLIAPFSDGLKAVTAKLADADYLKKSRVHPVAVLAALMTYKSGRSERGSNTWTPVAQVVDALDGAFYDSFGNVEPTGKRWFLGIDVSGSMWGGSVAGVPGLSPGLAAGAMAMVTARTEAQWYMGCFNTGMLPFAPSPKQRLDDFATMISRFPWGGTDCAQPMIYASQQNWPVDVFVVYTDNETWAGAIHPFQALKAYRQKTGIDAKLIVVGMTATEFTIADPSDAGMLDVVGFDTAVPQLMSQFAVQ